MSARGYLIALVQEEGARLKIYGAPAARAHCDQILEINGKSFGAASEHAELVAHILACIKVKSISLRVKRVPFVFADDKKSTLLDVFVIGTDAQQQLERFFKVSRISPHQQDDLTKLTGKMEMCELNNAPQVAPANSSAGYMASPQQQHQMQQQISMGMYRGHQQPRQPQSGLRYVNNSGNNQGNIQKQQISEQHRELPVDVPDSFVGIAKQSPRYPPPKSHRQVSPTMPMNSSSIFNSPQHAPSATATTLPQHQYNNAPNQQPQTQQFQQPPIVQSNAANIVSHNNSLRSSIKLKQLEKRGGNQYPVGQMQPAVNQAFEMNEGEHVPSNNVAASNHVSQQTHNANGYPNGGATHKSSAATNQAQQALKMKQSMPDLCSIYNRLQRNLTGEFSDVAGDSKFSKLLSIYNTIVQTHSKEFKIPDLTSRHATTLNYQEPLTYKVSDLVQSVASMLRSDEEMTNDIAELLCILCKHEVDGVCSAFDRITQSFEFAKSSEPPSPSRMGAQDQHLEMLLDNNAVNVHDQLPSQPQSFQNIQQQPPMYQHHHQHHPYQRQHQMGHPGYDYGQDGQVQMDIENNLYQNSLHPLTDIDLSDGACTKTVHIERCSTKALGATIKNEEDGKVVIGRIVCGGDAERSGLLHEGDEILEVNGIPMRGKNINEVVDILQEMQGTLTFKINIRNIYSKPNLLRNPKEKTFVRAFFDYDAETDGFMPCKELGLSFRKGEILTIIDKSDERWWQAYQECVGEHRLAGLIPSPNFMRQLESNMNHEDLAAAYSKHEKKNLVSLLFNCPKGSTSPRRRKRLANMLPEPDEAKYYEEVCLYYPNKYMKRPIILIGPKMIGQGDIVKKLLQDSNRFASAISHTSRPRQEGERNGVDFHFVTRAQFEADADVGKFIECGQYQNQYYGTSFDAMKEVVKSKKTCIHLLSTPSIFKFRNGRAGSELKPFFVFMRPNDSHPDKLKNLVSKYSPPKSNLDENINTVMAEVRTIEDHYLPYLDLVITVYDVDRAYQELLEEIGKIESEPQWIPMFWQETPSGQSEQTRR